jgi:hypothetical protein
MHSRFLLILLPIINALVTVEIHRNSLYDPQSPCAFIRNTSLSNDASIQSCIWECVHEQNCQTAVYYMTGEICSMFAEVFQNDRIQSSSNIPASVICCRKNHSKMNYVSEIGKISALRSCYRMSV